MNERTFKVLELHTIKEMLQKRTYSSLGADLANLLHPSIDIIQVKESLRETTQAVKALTSRGSVPLGDIYDIRQYLKKAQLDAILSPGDLLKIGRVLRTVKALKKYSSEAREKQKLDIIDGLISSLVPNKDFEESIFNAIINDEEISDNASVTLRTIRRHINDVNNGIKDKLNNIVHSTKYQKYLQDSIVTIRDGRYVIPVKQEYRSEIPGLVHDSSASGATLFIEPMAVVEANNKLKELRIKENIEIERILYELTSKVVELADVLENNIDILARLDLIFAKGRLSLDIKAYEPKINTKGYVSIKKARHPLINPDIVVPIDIELGGEFNTLIITGPNTGGKTVTLKTIGLFVLMAQCGLHIPAQEGSEISIFCKIFADIGDEQSIEQSLSTFSAHMINIVNIIKEADNTSLCLFDELGAGTDPTEGAALAMSILEHLHSVNAKTVATTHYSELKTFAISNKGYQNASCEFDIETLRPTYRVLMGIPGKSNAFEISKRLGLNDNIINTAKQYISKEEIDFEEVIRSLQKEKEIAEIERQKAEAYRVQIERIKTEFEEQKRFIEEKKDKIIYDAHQKALEILEEAKEEADDIIKEIREISKLQEIEEREKFITEAKNTLKSKLNRTENQITRQIISKSDNNAPLKAVTLGQKVYITSINQKGTILTLPDSEGNVQVQVGIMKINSKIGDLINAEDDESSKIDRFDKAAISKSFGVKSEIDVRGQTLDDSIILIDKYLDDAYLSRLNQITIIHGKGTGVLRSGIHQYLKKNRHVKNFRIGRYGEGESGVTIVELK